MLPKTSTEQFSRWTAFLILLVIWAGIFLPDLGTLEIKGEEGRRIMPALSMMETGNWIVPHIGGEGYYNKPPLINWLVAASFSLLNAHSELAARLPSVLSVLAFIAVIIFVGAPWLSIPARFLAAVIFITNVTLLEKGRLIEIDASYTCLTGIALVLWLNSYSKNDKWKTWLAPALVIGLGMLLKGPILLLFFYCPVILILKRARQSRRLISLPHIACVVIWLGIFLSWALLARSMGAGSQMTTRWWTELSSRLIPVQYDFGDWFGNFFRAFRNFSPWLLLTPLLWNRRWTSQIPAQWQDLYIAGRRSVAIVFLFVSLLPGALPRYSMPVFPLLSILLAWVLAVNVWSPVAERRAKIILLWAMVITCVAGIGGAVYWHASASKFVYLGALLAVTLWVVVRRQALTGQVRLTAAAGWLGVTVIATYIGVAVPFMHKREKFRPMAANINTNVPAATPLNVCRSFYNPMLFYIKPPVRYVDSSSLGTENVYLFGEKDMVSNLMAEAKAGERNPRSVIEFEDRGHRKFQMVELAAGK